jgi:hypothetical protein
MFQTAQEAWQENDLPQIRVVVLDPMLYRTLSHLVYSTLNREP